LPDRSKDQPGFVPEIWPAPAQELLLRACFSSGDEAVAAYREWDKCEGVDGIRSQSYPFLPLLYRNLSGAALSTERGGILEGTYRKTWYENQALLRHHTKFLNSLASAGIDALHLEGLPLAVRYYGDLGVRRLGSLRVLVRSTDMKRVMSLLGDLDYKMTIWQPPIQPPDFFRFRAGAESHR